MIAQATDAAVAKPRRRAVARSTKPQGDPKTKIGVYISAQSARKLGATALMEGRDRSDIVDELIARHLTRYVVQDRGRASEATLSAGEDRQETPVG